MLEHRVVCTTYVNIQCHLYFNSPDGLALTELVCWVLLKRIKFNKTMQSCWFQIHIVQRSLCLVLLWITVLLQKCYKVHILILKTNSILIELISYMPHLSLRLFENIRTLADNYSHCSHPLFFFYLFFLRERHANKHLSEGKVNCVEREK